MSTPAKPASAATRGQSNAQPSSAPSASAREGVGGVPNYQNPIRLHIVRFEGNTQQTEIITGNQTEGFGVRHILGKKGYRMLVKFNGKVWELHRNKNTDFFKVYDRKENQWIQVQFWAEKEADKWFQDEVWIALSKMSYRQSKAPSPASAPLKGVLLP